MGSDGCLVVWVLHGGLTPVLFSQMTEGRLCQVHLLDDRKLELLVQVRLISSHKALATALSTRLADLLSKIAHIYLFILSPSSCPGICWIWCHHILT